ncbi:MAG TPA: SDR family oxidoreductase [Steroidobacteraceae bacterium]|nr:SDR family oxidoreductase [Steroidobacteraceae bacterium]
MAYFVTGGTGFIGRHLVSELAKRGEPIHMLVRPGSHARLERVVSDCGERGSLIVPVEGDLTRGLLGVSARDRARLTGTIRHFFHLGAVYDLAAEAGELERANVLGTRNALELARALDTGCFHLVSSIAVAGRYRGTFTEEMFAQAQGLDREHPYFRSKHESEALVRAAGLAWRIYRPGMVVGHSASGAMDKIDGPYYMFKLIQKLRGALPAWVPLIGFEGGHVNFVPVDFVAAALAHLAHLPGQDGRCFHLTDPEDRRVGETLNVFARAAHAPVMSLRLEPSVLGSALGLAAAGAGRLPPLQRILEQLLRELGIPHSVAGLLDYPTVFDSTHAQRLLAPAGIAVPKLEHYAWRLWDYWERQLDPDLFKARNLREAVREKTVLITGGSSGIGRATALKLAAAGAHVLIVARDEARLAEVRTEIEARGGTVRTYVCDLSEPQACRQFLARLLGEHGHVDVLINNAGRSIRRAIENTYDRLHDYERVMRINYFAAVQVTLGLLPAMVAHGGGQVVSVSSIGVLTNAARFAAYNASKAALEAFTRCAAGEYHARGVHFAVVNLPLVRTPMVAPTKFYEQFPLIQPEQAADMLCHAIVHRSDRLATRLGRFAQLLDIFAPRLTRAVMSEAFTMYPESEAAGGAPGSDATKTPEMSAFASLMRGVHWS